MPDRGPPPEGPAQDTVTLWRPTGQAELDLVAASGWRAWPARLPEQPIFYPVLSRGYATRITREWNVPAGGVGYVTSFQVRRQFLDRYPVRQVGGDDIREYWIPAEELAEFNANIVGAIVEQADYRGPVPAEEFGVAESLGAVLPAAWRGYLRSESWFRRGWLPSGCYLWLYPPHESVELLDAWGEEAAANHPGVAIIGGDGSREHLVLDLRQDPAPVLLVDISSAGWPEAIPQADDVASFVQRVESGQFDVTWDEA
ncbi:hypothetical protein ACQEVC_01060 [Plantactinospora sp. CA-294935]|uniref:hypothetical protein n=1 Tax=Plantactinospora sp. CA-294935 TaxID=3240012 RepID=UPI003D8FFEF9